MEYTDIVLESFEKHTLQARINHLDPTLIILSKVSGSGREELARISAVALGQLAQTYQVVAQTYQARQQMEAQAQQRRVAQLQAGGQ